MKRNIIYLNDRPFELTLPTGGDDSPKSGSSSDWDKMIDLESNISNTFMGKVIGSFCLERNKAHSNRYVIRGLYSSRTWDLIDRETKSMEIGYRPVLIPLEVESLEFNPTFTEYFNGYSVKLGNFMVNGTVLESRYTHIFKPTDKVEIVSDIGHKDKCIEWTVVNGKLICSDNLLVNISRENLIAQGLLPQEEKKYVGTTIDTAFRGNYLCSNYVLVTTPTFFSGDGLDTFYEMDPGPSYTILAVKVPFIKDFINVEQSSYHDWKEFLEHCDLDSLSTLEYQAWQGDALAFSFRPDCKNKLILPRNVDDETLNVLSEFMKKYFKTV